MVALVGPSGAGKSTTSMLISRVYDVTGGAVLVGGVDVRDASLASLRDTIGVVTQDSHLFHETIADNLRYATPDATDDEIWAALTGAQIADLVRSLPDGLDTVVGERGYRFSGGEKQRIAIARLLLKAPSIVILDEATAHLDSESEAAVQRALSVALAGRTAHRDRAPALHRPRGRRCSSCSTTAGSSSAARTTSWSRPAVSTRSCIGPSSRSPIRRRRSWRDVPSRRSWWP